MSRNAIRYLFLTHRYLGIAVSLLMVMWCLSGVVMMYVSYPSLSQSARVTALPALDWHACCHWPADEELPPLGAVSIEMLGDRPVLRLANPFGDTQLVDLTRGNSLDDISEDEAAAVAQAFARHAHLPQDYGVRTVLSDQWTVSEEFDADRPLYQFRWNDPAATTLYVSSSSGQARQLTTASLRFWNWIGSVPHWLYFSALRTHAWIWTQIVIYTSALGCFLAVTGLYIGVRQFLRRPADRVSPYRGFMLWHHIPGLIFGVFALSWVLSGLLSMNPWGLLEGQSAARERQQLSGAPPAWAQLRNALKAVSLDPSLADLVSIKSSILEGRLYLIGTRSDGTRVRLTADGRAAPLSAAQLVTEARLIGAAAIVPDRLDKPDQFYFSHHSEPVDFPVYRLVLSDSQQTRYYLDPVSGEIRRKFDRGAQGYRWWHEGLHRLDFASVIRARPVWDVLMLLLLGGVTCLFMTGLYAAWRRVSGQGRPASW